MTEGDRRERLAVVLEGLLACESEDEGGAVPPGYTIHHGGAFGMPSFADGTTTTYRPVRDGLKEQLGRLGYYHKRRDAVRETWRHLAMETLKDERAFRAHALFSTKA